MRRNKLANFQLFCSARCNQEINIEKSTELSLGPPEWCTSFVHQYVGQIGVQDKQHILLKMTRVFTSE